MSFHKRVLRIRSCVFIEDVVEALRLAVEASCEIEDGSRYCIS